MSGVEIDSLSGGEIDSLSGGGVNSLSGGEDPPETPLKLLTESVHNSVNNLSETEAKARHQRHIHKMTKKCPLRGGVDKSGT